MKLQTISTAMVIVATLWATAQGQDCPSHRAFVAIFEHVDESRPAYPRGTYTRVMETHCHPSRGSLLMRTIQQAKADPLNHREARAKITALRNQMTRAERKETAKLFRIQANERKYLAQQARIAQRITDREQDRGQSRFASAR